MKISKWRSLKVVKNLETINEGDCFLMGERVAEQKETKKIGDEISYYKILKKGKNIEYIPLYDMLEEG